MHPFTIYLVGPLDLRHIYNDVKSVASMIFTGEHAAYKNSDYAGRFVSRERNGS